MASGIRMQYPTTKTTGARCNDQKESCGPCIIKMYPRIMTMTPARKIR
ncbi:MAG: hypothetical protein JRJ73_16415 [Deltaproteobacteria bacterium]|nr:hypothetical protein [Deltaproteobacteria bacterium]